MKKALSILVFFFLISGCARVVDKKSFKLPKDKVYAVVPFENYTDTPLAGFRVASILEGVMRARGYKLAPRVWEYTEDEPTKEELKRWVEEAKKRSDYVITGSVSEFRYKTGIDGEPAVSITLLLINSKTGEAEGGSALSASGWAHESVGTLTQKLLRGLIK
ncbi:MAG: hypothetical protein GXO04_01245 [Aquificae bacterium]|nr:hypothetical protein [Aquificota bacterium]